MVQSQLMGNIMLGAACGYKKQKTEKVRKSIMHLPTNIPGLAPFQIAFADKQETKQVALED